MFGIILMICLIIFFYAPILYMIVFSKNIYYDNEYYEYDELPNGCVGAEFTFEFEGKTEVKTECGSVYIKNADGSYEDIGQKTRIDGNVTLFWAMPAAEDNAESVMTIKNRSGEWTLILERAEGEYKANLVTAE